MQDLSISLLIATYNWPKALELCLISALHQSVAPSEIIIADDGSKEETTELIRRYAAQSPIPILHIWQEDKGFRLAAIRNKAIAAAHYPYIVQVDGDVVLHRHFIRDHIRCAKPGYIASGSRVMVSEQTSAKMLNEKNIKFNLFTPGLCNRDKHIRVPLLASLFKNYKPNKVKGCNMAYWRDDIIQVNGYNEQMEGWGWEDIELVMRMRNNGCRKRTLKYIGIVYHLYHKEASRNNAEQNRILQQQADSEKHTRCKKGINQYLSQE